jgi:hypothetical protein
LSTLNASLSFPVLLSVVFGIGVSGCNGKVVPGVDFDHPTEVTTAQLKEATEGEDFFVWLGSDRNFHYFHTKKGFYRLTSKFKMSQFDNGRRSFERLIKNDIKPGSFGMDVCFDGGEIVYHKGGKSK